jgi:hypothetical protein
VTVTFTQLRLAALVVVAIAAPWPASGQGADTEDPQVVPPVALPPVAPSEKRVADGRRTPGRLVSNFGRSLAGFVSHESVAPILITAGATGLGAIFDDDLKQYFSDERRAKWLGNSGDQLGKPYVILPLAATLYGLGRLDHHHQRWRDATYDVAEVTLVAAVPSFILKYTVQRRRPDGSNKQSFPSGHTSNAFAWATIGAHYYGWKLAVPAYAVAGLIGVSRMDKNVHHLSDVIAGAGIGILSARTVLRKDSETLPSGQARLLLAPMGDAHGTGIGLRATLTF